MERLEVGRIKNNVELQVTNAQRRLRAAYVANGTHNRTSYEGRENIIAYHVHFVEEMASVRRRKKWEMQYYRSCQK